jgi:hypothetical protein
LERLQAKVLEERPDLVLVGFGMNDHNTMGVPLPQFEQNLKEMVARIRQETGAEVLGNNINHPNDFGHWIYYRVLSALGLRASRWRFRAWPARQDVCAAKDGRASSGAEMTPSITGKATKPEPVKPTLVSPVPC